MFNTELFAIITCSKKSIWRGQIAEKINIYTDSQAIIQAIFLNRLTRLNTVSLILVPIREGISGNSVSDQLTNESFLQVRTILSIIGGDAKHEIR